MQIWYYAIRPQTCTVCGGRKRQGHLPPTSSHPANTAHKDFSLGTLQKYKPDPHLPTTLTVSVEICPAVLSPSHFFNFKPATEASPNSRWNTGTGCPERQWRPHPWKHSRPVWTGLWATWSSWRCPSSLQGGWARWPLKVPSNPKHSMILYPQKIIKMALKSGNFAH